MLPYKNALTINSFLENTKRQNKINPQEFWIFREFYSPGLLTINKKANNRGFLIYKSKKIKSIESLIESTELESKYFPSTEGKQILFQTSSELIYLENSSLMRIVFIKPISEMITANAVFDYKDKDRKLLESKLWHVVTDIKK